MTWDYFKRLRDTTKMKIVLKGILAWEDAVLAADNGIDGIIVSNHGARSEDSGRSTIDALPEIVEAVNGRIPIMVDCGFRRGSDIVKALCMGATAVCVGRPYIWGLGAFGQPGVERVLELLRIETTRMMQQVGAPNDQGTRRPRWCAGREHDIPVALRADECRSERAVDLGGVMAGLVRPSTSSLLPENAEARHGCSAQGLA